MKIFLKITEDINKNQKSIPLKLGTTKMVIAKTIIYGEK
tara:strand:+ start:346 stop:462 length:117 start_codon:yes stop_codon:yes gene_type:complete